MQQPTKMEPAADLWPVNSRGEHGRPAPPPAVPDQLRRLGEIARQKIETRGRVGPSKT